MSERKQGWYHFKLTGQRQWHCAFWDAEHGVWDAPTYVCNVNHLDESEWIIGPRIPSPDEPWQCVPVKLTSEMFRAMDDMTYCDDWHELYEAALHAAPKP